MSSTNVFAVSLFVLLIQFGYASSDLGQDRSECADKLVGLATCLPYVGGEAKAPTIDCCSGIKDVIQKSMKCLCILVQDRDDPKLGLKINTTLALELPAECKVPTNLTKCIDLLHLQPSSADAKLFSDFAHSLQNSNSTTLALDGTHADEKSGGGKTTGCLKLELISGVLLWFLYVIV